METTDANGDVQEFLVEVKPHKQTMEPERKKGKNGKLLKAAMTYAINQAKWEAATAFAKKRNMKFLILTEKTVHSGFTLAAPTMKKRSK